MPRDGRFSERSMRYRNVKLLCPNGHDVNPVTAINDVGFAVLTCGCTRTEILPLQDGRISFESISPFAGKEQFRVSQRLFPGNVSSEKTAQRIWGAPLGYAA